MTPFRCAVGLIGACFVSTIGPATGGIQPTPYKDALSSGGTIVTLPFKVVQTASNRNVFLQFSNPLFDQIVSINSIEVTLNLSDNDDGASESANVLFAVRAADGPDVLLGGGAGSPSVTPGDLDGTTPESPFVFNYSLTSSEIAAVLPTLTNNAVFRILVQRVNAPSPGDGGDLTVLPDPEVIIDAELRPLAELPPFAVPEPGTLACFAAGLGWLAWSRRRRKIG